MKDLWELLEPIWEILGLPGTAAFFGFIAVVGPAIWKYLKQLRTLRKQRKQLHDLHPFYTEQEKQRATQYYVETTGQNVAPSKGDEHRDARSFSAKEPMIPFLLKEAFNPNKHDSKFYFVLADSGMGKTTFLINLYLRYINQFFTPQFRIKLFPLGYPEIDREIEEIPKEIKRQTILLLDAFDEDMQAVLDYKARLSDLARKVRDFREVVITCRTQFFPSEIEEPGETGVLRFGPDGGSHVFYKFYLSPFNEADIQTYLRKRFSWVQSAKRRKARQIVLSCKNLMVRPMLLSHIEDLLKGEHAYTATYMVYTELIDRWIEREADKFPPERREDYMKDLYQFSREIALYLYQHRTEHQGLLISGEEIQPFAEKHQITLSPKEMTSKSLLNRNAQGQYKFSHKSILEYFLAEEAISNPEFRRELNFDGMSAAKVFFDEMVWGRLTVPFFSRGDVEGHYTVKDGKSRVLMKLPEKILSTITTLTLEHWDVSNDLLLFSGLPSLKRVEVTEHQPVTIIWAVLRDQEMTVSEDGMKDVFELDVNNRPRVYIASQYEDQGMGVFDHATGLLWQKSGSDTYMINEDALKYVKQLNQEKFAGYADWRLPTIPELMSLLEPEKQSNGLYIDPIFDKEQRWCWSADWRVKGEGSAGSAWLVGFGSGFVHWLNVKNLNYVRCVRS
ncbi:MAG: DUF1566 domain-containing protein [bacterium]|nr:DUF1566 domain-containing protein [bacterium]